MSGQLDFIRTFTVPLVIDNAELHMLAEPINILKSNETIRLVNTLHTHSFCELFACGGGSMVFNVNGSPAALESGDAILIPPMLPHCIVSCEGADWGAVSFSFSRHPGGSGTQDLYALLYALVSSGTAQHLYDVPILYDDMLALNTLLAENADRSAAVRFAEIVVLFAELCSQRAMQVSRGNDGSASRDDDDMTRLNTLNTIINTGFMYRLTARELAGRLFLSERQLSRIVRKHYGTTLNGIITEKRLSAAKMLLETSERPLSEISAAVGFGSAAGFYREFTKKYGVPPAKYRKQSRMP